MKYALYKGEERVSDAGNLAETQRFRLLAMWDDFNRAVIDDAPFERPGYTIREVNDD